MSRSCPTCAACPLTLLWYVSQYSREDEQIHKAPHRTSQKESTLKWLPRRSCGKMLTTFKALRSQVAKRSLPQVDPCHGPIEGRTFTKSAMSIYGRLRHHAVSSIAAQTGAVEATDKRIRARSCPSSRVARQQFRLRDDGTWTL